MQYSTPCTLAYKPSGVSLPLPTLSSLTKRIEDLLDYDFASPTLCHDALVAGKEQRRLASLAPAEYGGDDEVLVAAAKQFGIDGLFATTKRGGVVSDGQLALTVRALLGAVFEDCGEENEVVRVAFCLGLEEAEGGVEGRQDGMVGDLLGVEEFRFVVTAVSSVPVVRSLI